jgi:hypothetical protein
VARDYVQLSRVLSHALRHEPWLYELELDADGWTQVEAVLAALREERSDWRDLTPADLVEMMRRASKQRYELAEGRIAKAEIDKQNAELIRQRDALFAQRDQYIKDQRAVRPDADAKRLDEEFWQQKPKLKRDWSDIAHQLDDTAERLAKEQWEQYKRLAGEVEADNVVERADDDDAKRRIKPPEDSAAYTNSEQLVLPPRQPPAPPRTGYTAPRP